MKKATSLLLAFLMAFALFSCGDVSQPSGNPSESESMLASDSDTDSLAADSSSEASDESESESAKQNETDIADGSTSDEGETDNTDTEIDFQTPVSNELISHFAPNTLTATKLRNMEFYYRNFYIGDLPENELLISQTKALFDEYFSKTIDKTDETALTDAVLTCFQFATGDKYAVYLDKEAYEDYQTDYDAEFIGIGVYVSYNSIQETVQVLSVFKDSPAAKAGILPGDYMISVDGNSLEDIGYYDFVNRIRGEAGTAVTVTVLRDNQQIDFSMVRMPLTGVSVTYRLLEQDAEIGYVKIEQFDSKTFEQFKEAVDSLIESGAKGLVFDLRGNPGGELNAIISVLDYLLPDGNAIAHIRYAPKTLMPSQSIVAGDGHFVNLPMTVLCDGYTASAGELFTVALRDYEVATIIGVTTYGKGTMQSVLDFGDGSAFTISIARYDPPFGANYEGIGVIPDIIEELSEEAASVNAFLRDDLDDNQLQKAVAEIVRLRQPVLQ